MGYENDPYMDEDGEPLMDPDIPSDREASLEPMDPIDDDDDGDWRRERSPTPVLDSAAEGKDGKPRQRLVKKSAMESSPDREWSPAAAGLEDWEEEPLEKKRKKAPSVKQGKGGSGGMEKKEILFFQGRAVGGEGVQVGIEGLPRRVERSSW